MMKTLWNRALSAALAVSLTAAMAVPAFASGNVKYKAADDTTHTLRWAEGIAEPKMPTEEEKGDFAETQVTIAGNVMNVMEAPFRGAQGWYDLKQEPRKNPRYEEKKETLPEGETQEQEEEFILDSGYLAAAANLTYWWLEQNQDRISLYLESNPKQAEGLAPLRQLVELQIAPASQSTADSAVYRHYLKAFPEETEPDLLLNFFLNGMKDPETGSGDPGALGGFFHPAFKEEKLTHRKEVSMETLKNAIVKNDGAILRLEKDGEQRYMNLWGMETGEGGKLIALFVTDSLDDRGMLRIEVQDQNPMVLAGMEIKGLYTVELGEALFEAYQESLTGKEPNPEEKPSENPTEAPQIVWGKPSYEWSKDNSTCTATRTAQNGSRQAETEKVKAVRQQTQAPTHKEPGIITYVADFQADWAETQTRTEEIPVKEVKWNAPTYEWDESMRICRAVRTAQGDPSIQETAETGVKAKETRQPTCTRKGQTTFTAKFEEPWAETQEKVLDNIEKLTPNWNVTEYKWSPDHKTCTAVRVCKNETDGSHVEKIQGTVTSEQTRKPTSTKKGETTYTAKFNVDWAEKQTVTAEDVPVLDAKWSRPTYQWSEDLKTCTAVRQDQNDPDRKETAIASVTSKVTKPATCKEKGETTYTAEFKEDWAATQTETRADLPMLEPKWGKVRYQWSEDHKSCTAIRVCENEKDHIETAAAKIVSERIKEPTMNSKGETKYTAVFKVDWAESQVVTVKDIPKVQDLWNTPSYEWTEDLSKCIATRVNQKDKDLVETAYAVVTSQKTKAPTNNMKGETTYTATFKEDWANTQKKVVANIPPIPTNPNGKPKPTEPPQWNAPTYEWSEDNSRCTAKRSRRGDDSNADLTWATVTKKVIKAPTCDKPGEAVYTAKFTESWAKTQTLKGAIPTLEHKLQKVEATAATAGKPGIKAHYKCTECGNLFLDAEGKKQVTMDQLRQSGHSVTDGYAILNGVPEKDHLIAIAPDKFQKTLDENPESVGVSVSVGSASVTYDKKDIETILQSAGDSKKLQLEIYRTDATDSGLTLEQIQSADRNPGGILYMVQLSYVKNNKNVPIENLTGSRITVPYTGTDAVRAYEMAEDGTFREVASSFKDAYTVFEGGNGVYMLSESRPSADAPQKSGSKIGMIIWTSILVVSGLLCIGLVGFYFYQKKLEQEEEEAPHRFSHPGRTETIDYEPETEKDILPEETDSDFMKELDAVLGENPEQIPSAEEPKTDQKPDEGTAPKPVYRKTEVSHPVSPVAPRAPMQEKPTIAEKTAEAVNHSKHPKA